MRCIFSFILFFGVLSSQAQNVFSSQYANQADVSVFVVDYENQCDLKVFKVDYANQSDLKIYFVKYKNQSGWRNKSKQHLLY